MRSNFIDEVLVTVGSGHGGPGAVSFRREKYIPFGGPDGGNGGKGGDVIAIADPQLGTLLDYKFQRRHMAKDGNRGEGRQCSGLDGPDTVLKLPVGTMIFNADTNELIADMSEAGAHIVLCKGGRGGKGNEHFRSSTQQAPKFAQPGEEGEERNIRLELKLLADVGLVGFPNVGKSSLITKVSAARPKVADYPFTTLEPKLGVVSLGYEQSFVIADVPGIIVGAHTGLGLGTRFLRHIERVRRIAHLITVEPDVDHRDPVGDFEAIENEMRLHNASLGDVPQVMVLNRIDLPFVADERGRVESYAKQRGIPFFAISAATGEGTTELIKFLGHAVLTERSAGMTPKGLRLESIPPPQSAEEDADSEAFEDDAVE
ncbi:MAG: GTPase ObgE [Clostridia bacterium]|nr:GTPase ObgE [Deltaproteobacteria bacterium]